MSVHEPPPPTGVPTPSIVHLPSGSCSSRMISSLQSNKKSPSIRAFENRDTGNENAGIPPRIPQRKPTLAGLRQQQTQQKSTAATGDTRIPFHPSPIQTLTVGPGVSPDPPQNAGHGLEEIPSITAGREFHPAPKDVDQLIQLDRMRDHVYIVSYPNPVWEPMPSVTGSRDHFSYLGAERDPVVLPGWTHLQAKVTDRRKEEADEGCVAEGHHQLQLGQNDCTTGQHLKHS